MQNKLTPLEEVLDLLEQSAKPLDDRETVALGEASGRILAQDLISPFDVPAFDNSRMDGYAVRADECTTPLLISQVIAAGHPATPLEQGTAARIFTGALLPAGADSVVMQENTQTDGKTVTFNKAVEANQFIGRTGEDIAKGQIVLQAGHRLQPQDVGLAASMGVATLSVIRRPRVAMFSTGDELKEPGESLETGQIYNSNRYQLSALIKGSGCELMDFGIVADDLEQTQAKLAEAAQDADMVITSGGVSVGEKDYLRDALDKIGKLNLWCINIKPGKPLVFGHLNAASAKQTPYMGLPGNPVSVFVTYLMLAQPFLFKLAGANISRPQSFRVVAGFDQSRAQSRRQFLRCRLEVQDGQLTAVPFDNQSSSILSSTSSSNGLGVVMEERTLARGDLIDFYPYQGLL
ncbi:MAG: molybdopterin molybdotransferase MoeA [bacterium]|nr:molybdopterin molybdotransferase MoeA [bacterium]